MLCAEGAMPATSQLMFGDARPPVPKLRTSTTTSFAEGATPAHASGIDVLAPLQV
jgi:hypothetical protein